MTTKSTTSWCSRRTCSGRLGRATPRGKQLYAIARDVVAEIDAEWTKRLGKTKMRQLRGLLEELNAGL